MWSIPVTATKDGKPQHKRIANISKYRFWNPNAYMTTWVLIVDLDTDSWLIPVMEFIQDHPDLTPSWVIEKGSNGHGQIAWMIEHVSHGPESKPKPQNLARMVRQALTNAFGGDQYFTNTRSWNPFWTGWKQHNAGDVIWFSTPPKPYTLRHLRSALMAADRWDISSPVRFDPVSEASATADMSTDMSEIMPGCRNQTLFDTTRKRHELGLHGSVEEIAVQLNNQLSEPLSANELNTMIKSIEEYEGGEKGSGSAMSRQNRQKQAQRGAKGGSRNTEAQKAARAKGPEAAAAVRTAEATGRAAVIGYWHEQGLTRRQIMEKTGFSESTVKRGIREHRNGSG